MTATVQYQPAELDRQNRQSFCSSLAAERADQTTRRTATD